MSPDGIWIPGAPQPSLEDFVSRLHTHIERFATEHADGQVAVEIELRDGTVLRLLSVHAEPGYGFVTLAPHREDGKAEEMIVPVAAIARITLGPAEEEPPVGFGRPEAATA